MYSLKDAAEATGKGKPAILKALQKGRISGKKNEHGEWVIDPAELHRVYPPISGNGNRSVASERQETGKETGSLYREIELLRDHLADKDAQIIDLRSERDHLLKILEEQAATVKLLSYQDERNGEADTKSEPKPLARPWLVVTGLIVILAALVAIATERLMP
jgi:hypothetical protein